MKFFLLSFLKDKPKSISEVKVLSDNILINTGKTLYTPVWIKQLAYTPVLLVKISKVAKCIEPQYVERYYEKVALGLSIVATDTSQEIPEQMRYCFDDSLVKGDTWCSIEKQLDQKIKVAQVEGAKLLHIQPDQPINYPSYDTINDTIALLSSYFILKIGDVIAFPLWSQREKINQGEGVFITDDHEKELIYYGIR